MANTQHIRCNTIPLGWVSLSNDSTLVKSSKCCHTTWRLYGAQRHNDCLETEGKPLGPGSSAYITHYSTPSALIYLLSWAWPGLQRQGPYLRGWHYQWVQTTPDKVMHISCWSPSKLLSTIIYRCLSFTHFRMILNIKKWDMLLMDFMANCILDTEQSHGVRKSYIFKINTI